MMTASWAKHLGRDPVLGFEHKGWTIEVYRVGRRQEYQALAIDPGGKERQTGRIGGPGALTRAGYEARLIVDTQIGGLEPWESR